MEVGAAAQAFQRGISLMCHWLERLTGRSFPQPSKGWQIALFNRLNMYHPPLDSGERQYKSRA